MNLFDYVLLAVVGLSVVLSLWRGFVREIISLIGIVAAFFAASRASGLGGDLLGDWIPNETVADIAAFAIIFAAVMLLVGLAGMVIRKLVDMAELTATDRTLGILFGLARGVLLIGLFFLIYTSYTKADRAWMKKSFFTPYAIELGDFIGKAIPAGYPFSRRGKPNLPSVNKVIDKISDRDKKKVKNIIEETMK